MSTSHLSRGDIERIRDLADSRKRRPPMTQVEANHAAFQAATTALDAMKERDAIRDVAAWRGTMLTRYHDLRCSVFSDLPTERALNEGLGVGNDCNCGEQDALVAANAALREEVHDKADLYVEAKTLYVKAKARADTAEARARVLADERDAVVDRAAALEEGLREVMSIWDDPVLVPESRASIIRDNARALLAEWSENVKGRYTIKPAITVEDSPAGPVTVVKMRPALTERDMEKGGAAG